ncbi:MAG: hypothetical protein IKP47_08550 [Ruminococcus sp.]|nr:hypothetical protein [Ruminococcus sp.]
MKKRVSLRLAALGAAAALVLTACGSEDSSSQEVTETSAVTTVQTTAATVTSAPETVTETQTTVWEEPPLPEPIEVYGVSETDTKGMYRINKEYEEDQSRCFRIRDGLMLESHRIEKGTAAELIDLSTGGVLGRYEAPEYNADFSFTQGGVVYTGSSKLVIVLDYSMKEQERYELPFFAPKTAYYDRINGILLCQSDIGHSAKLYDVKNDKEIPLSKEIGYYDCEGFDGETFICRGMESDLVMIGEDGKITEQNFGGKLEIIGDKGVAKQPDGTVCFANAEDKGISRAKVAFEESDYAWSAYGDYIVMQAGSTGMSVLDISNKQQALIEDLGGMVSMLLMDSSGTAVINVINMNNFNQTPVVIRFAELEGAKSFEIEENAEIPEIYAEYFAEPDSSDPTVAELIDGLYEDYGIRVFLAPNEGMEDKIFSGYDVTPFDESDEVIAERLRDVRSYFELWPKDICREITKGGLETLFILCGSIYSNDSGAADTVSSAAGCVSEIGAFTVIGLTNQDSYIFTQNLSHEFIHALDHGISNEVFDEWSELSPEDSYSNSYTEWEAAPDDRYVYIEGADKDGVFFVDSYACTNYSEDRARIGEYLWISYEENELNDMFIGTPLGRKAKELCRELRDNYPCLSGIKEGDLYLETFLDQAG